MKRWVTRIRKTCGIILPYATNVLIGTYLQGARSGGRICENRAHWCCVDSSPTAVQRFAALRLLGRSLGQAPFAAAVDDRSGPFLRSFPGEQQQGWRVRFHCNRPKEVQIQTFSE